MVDIVENTSLSPKELASGREISKQLSQLTVERTKSFNAQDWIGVSDNMVNLFNSFPEWNGPVLDNLQEVFDGALEKVKDKNPQEAEKFITRWNGWIAEATVRRVHERLGVGPLQVSRELDKHGVDGMTVLADAKNSFIIFLQIKSSRSVPPGLYLVNPALAGHHDEVQVMGGETRKVHNMIDSQSYTRLQEGGDIYEFCTREAREVRSKFLEKNKRNGINADTHQSHMLLLMASVGVEAQDEESLYGWKELMKIVRMDKEKPTMLADYKRQLLSNLSHGEKVEEVT